MGPVMDVEATLFYWTKDGMRCTAPVAHAVPYIQKSEAERLLEAAHRRAFQLGKEAAALEIQDLVLKDLLK